MFDWFSIIFGVVLILLALLDVFLTVLYARMANGIISPRLACWTWRLFRVIATPAGRFRDQILSFCGPCLLVLLVFVWVSMLVLGGALVIWPSLGTSVQANVGPTPTDFSTAVYVAGDALTTVGASDIAPKTPFYRLFYTFMAVIGLCTVTLTVTYFLQIYNALHARNTYVLKAHHATAGTGDAVELVAGLGSGGDFQHGYTHLAEMAAETTELYESHHFYPVLLYFRFREPHYALARAALVTLDLITLIKSALDDRRYAWLKESAAVVQIWDAAMRTLVELSIVFLPDGIPEKEAAPEVVARWRARYQAAVRRLRHANITTMPDEQAGEEVYVSLRARWDRYVAAFADHMMHTMDVIDPAGANPDSIADRPEFTQRLRAVG